MQPYIDIEIQKDSPTNRDYLLNRKRDAKLAADVSVVYIYALVDERVNYPNESGHVIYIGEAGRPSEPTGKRFAQHISTSETQGGDTGTIFSLSRYYWRGKRIRLQVLIVNDREARKSLERQLLCAHVKKFGALPICQGTTGDNYGTTMLTNFAIPSECLALLLPASDSSGKAAPLGSSVSPRMDDEIRRMLRAAQERIRDADLLARSMERRSDSDAMLRILGLEILLKCAQVVVGQAPKNSHNYRRLWLGLPDHVRTRVLAVAAEQMPGHADLSDLETKLDWYQFIFEKARYQYEIYKGYTDEQLSELGALWVSLGAPTHEAVVQYYPNELHCLIAGLMTFIESEVRPCAPEEQPAATHLTRQS